ncbi:MAG: hypothetical protein SFU25_08550 [Candidatus Caenarcaniphilales bacterium]|nr:hypothetical protein [Candidatus Caenarcaniphilales bacterium]
MNHIDLAMKTRNIFSYTIFLTALTVSLGTIQEVAVLESKAQDYGSNPYASGGNQYGGDTLESSSSSYPSSSLSDSNTNSYPSGNSYPSAASSGGTANSYSASPDGGEAPATRWDKMEQWFQRKTNRPTGEPEMDLANQRIKAGKARLKAIKAKDKLEKHIADSNAKTEELKKELEKSEEQAKLIENQVKLQEINQNDAVSSDY